MPHHVLRGTLRSQSDDSGRLRYESSQAGSGFRACVAPPPDEGVALSIAGIFALGGGCYDNDKRHRKGGYHHKSHKKDYDDHYSKSRYHRSYKCDDCDDDDGLLSDILG